VAWPTLEWPRGEPTARVAQLVDAAFTDEAVATSLAVVVVQGGRLIAERYGGTLPHFDRPPEPVTNETPLLSWSMAKSITHFLVGLLVDEKVLVPGSPAAVPEWGGDGDPRGAITLADMLAMRDGLRWVEDYVDGEVSDVIEMLFGSGVSDTAAFAAAKALAHGPGTVFNYSSGTTNLISRLLASHVGAGDAFEGFMRDRLFEPIGMRSARVTLDGAGTFIGSSYVYATAHDFARFGTLYLRGGEWDGSRLISRSWVDTAQVPLSHDPDSESYYSWHWWLPGDEFGTYVANGYEGQLIAVVPALDAVVVRCGKTPAEGYPALRRWRNELVAALAG
jgi:CubicO group peptidase (beta-lactamase class C family)